MTTKKITELVAATTVAPTDLVPLVDMTGPTTKKLTGALLQVLMGVKGNPLAGGRLTLSATDPISMTDVTGASTLYYLPYTCGLINLFDGTDWQPRAFTSVSIVLSALTSAKNYDVFAYWTGTVVALELSAAWGSSTARTDALVRQDGIVVKNAVKTRRWVGTIRTSSTTTTEDSEAQRFVFNVYNQVTRQLKNPKETANTWAITGGSFVQANSNTANQVEYVVGDAATLVNARVVGMGNDTLSGGVTAGIGIDSTSVNSAIYYGDNSPPGTAIRTDSIYAGYPGLGYHALKWINASQNDSTGYGDAGQPTYYQMGLTAVIVM